MSVRPTRFGLKGTFFVALLWCSFYAAPYLNLFFLLLSFLGVFASFTLILGSWNMRGVTGKAHDIAPYPAGAEGLTQVTIESQHRRHAIGVDFKIGGKWRRIGYAATVRGSTVVDCVLPSLPRGIHALDGVRVHSSYPYGAMRVLRAVPHPNEIAVYPTPADLSAFRDRSELLSSLGAQGGTEAAERGPSGLREYKIGDELRDVHWKASARRIGLVVREYEGDSTPGLEILLDLRCKQEALEDSLSLIAALAVEARTTKDLLTLTTQNHRATYGKGHTSFAELWRYLAEAQPIDEDAPPPPTASPGILRLPAQEAWR